MKRLKNSNYIDSTSWMVPYGTLMMILMIFFVILYSFSQLDSNIQYEKTLASLQSTVTGKTLQVLKEAEVAYTIEDMFKEEGLEKYVEISIDAQMIRIALTQDIVFDSGSVLLKETAKKTLSKLAGMIKGLPNSIIVEGHTDNIPVKGYKYSSNWELSALRAFSVIKYFIDHEGILPTRLYAHGYGQYKPVQSNETSEGRSKNRRIEISIMREKASL